MQHLHAQAWPEGCDYKDHDGHPINIDIKPGYD